MRFRRAALTLLALCLLVTPEHAVAGVDRWTGNGPSGGMARSIAVHPTNPDILLTGSYGAGIFRSTDRGHTWRRSSGGLPPDIIIGSIAFLPAKPSTVFATTQPGSMYKSTDGGRTWSRTASSDIANLGGLAVHPTHPNIIWVNTGTDGVFRSEDEGATWTQVYLAPDRPLTGGVMYAPSDPRIMYSTGQDVLVSNDGGQTWSDTGGRGGFTRFVVHPTNPKVLYGGDSFGFHKSVDGGVTWAQIATLPVLDTAMSLAIDPYDPSRVYAGAEFSGVYLFTHGGAHVERYNQGLPGRWITGFRPLPNGVVLVASAHHGIFRRRIGDAAWTSSREGFSNSQVSSLATAPSRGRVVYAGLRSQGVARSTDGGATWRFRGLSGPGPSTVEALAVHPTNPDVVYAARLGGIYRTTNGGANWDWQLRVNDLKDLYTTDVVVSPSSPRIVYGATFQFGVWRSADHGRTWRKTQLDSDVTALAIHPTRPNTVYAGTRTKFIAKTTDGGKTWKSGSGTHVFQETKDIAIHPRRPRKVFAAMSTGGIYRSGDGGATWRRLDGGTAPTSASSVVIDPRRPWRIYAGHGGEVEPGVYRSRDSGRTWSRMNTGLTIARWVSALAIQPDGSKLHAGTSQWAAMAGGGVFSYRFE